jgi:hypothetical protein
MMLYDDNVTAIEGTTKPSAESKLTLRVILDEATSKLERCNYWITECKQYINEDYQKYHDDITKEIEALTTVKKGTTPIDLNEFDKQRLQIETETDELNKAKATMTKQEFMMRKQALRKKRKAFLKPYRKYNDLKERMVHVESKLEERKENLVEIMRVKSLLKEFIKSTKHAVESGEFGDDKTTSVAEMVKTAKESSSPNAEKFLSAFNLEGTSHFMMPRKDRRRGRISLYNA